MLVVSKGPACTLWLRSEVPGGPSKLAGHVLQYRVEELLDERRAGQGVA